MMIESQVNGANAAVVEAQAVESGMENIFWKCMSILYMFSSRSRSRNRKRSRFCLLPLCSLIIISARKAKKLSSKYIIKSRYH
jgi:hypothetical protein